jgi:UDP-N-acetylmuramoyl-tripeptide--D-alanyl-D-alanine ligase
MMFSLSQWAKWLKVDYTGDDLQFSGVSIDSRSIKPGQLFIALKGEQFDGHDYIAQAKANGAIAAMVERPIEELACILVPNTRIALGQAGASWLRELNLPVAAITGSNGKTTVKEMLAAILREHYEVYWSQGNFNNDYGLPLSLLQLKSNHQCVVLEMGANHPGEIAYLTQLAPPNLALINNVFPAHTEGFGSLDGIAQSKAEIYQGLVQNGTALLNIEDKYADYWRTLIKDKKVISFGMSPQADIWGKPLSTESFELHTPKGMVSIELQLLGEHNVCNAVAASAAAYAWDMPLAKIKTGLENMRPVKGRLATQQGKQGSQIIDDTYNANPGSVAAAIKVLASFSDTKVLVLGDMRELGPNASQYHREVGQLAQKAGIDKLLTLGQLSKEAAVAFGHDAEHFSERDKLVARLHVLMSAKTTILIKGSRGMKMETIVAELINQ